VKNVESELQAFDANKIAPEQATTDKKLLDSGEANDKLTKLQKAVEHRCEEFN
jgi:hypothetical protein